MYYLQFDNYKTMKDFEWSLIDAGLYYHEWENEDDYNYADNQYWHLSCELTEEVREQYEWQVIKEYAYDWCSEEHITSFWTAYEQYRMLYRIYEEHDAAIGLYIRPVEIVEVMDFCLDEE